MSLNLISRLIGLVLLALVGWQVGASLVPPTDPNHIRYVAAAGALAGLVGFMVTPYVTVMPVRWVLRWLKSLEAADLVGMAMGLLVGFVFAALLALPLSMLPYPLGQITPFAASIFFGYLGAAVMLHRRREIFEFLAERRPFGDGSKKEASGRRGLLVDTSAIIDGRVADILRTGFLEGPLVIPSFVLLELQKVADSADNVRRARGRRGLDMLNRLQKEFPSAIRILDADVPDEREVDAKLVRLARQYRLAIITNDYNLNRVAELRGVKVLNVNELANALKPVVMPGEEMVVKVIQEGKEVGQGIAFLDDGTMVVVENGWKYINSEADVVVTRVLQTSAGRMIFAHVKEE
jgi:uncharacterized protein YacL